jgi:23S rRNA pseudouridine1911/1915/1917 synthase
MSPEHDPGSDTAAAFEIIAGPAETGRRLDQLLAEPLGSRARATRAIEAGLVRVDGRPVRKSHLVAAGERVSVATDRGAPSGRYGSAGAPVEDLPDATAEYAVAYDDDYLLIVDKPAGVVVHPARGHWSGTLAQALAGRAAGGEEGYRAGIVHRLDRDTSGLLVVAKSDEVHRALKALLAKRGLRREYLALVDGVPEARTGTIDAPIGRDRRDRIVMSLDTDVPREARTHFEVIEALTGVALLRVVLETGRTHQIRVHMQAIGHPICGDEVYGGGRRFGLRRQFLHAARLTFDHPVTGARVDVSSPLPSDLQSALELARE